ncbi:MAG TPA: hypothetical protein VGS27_03120 [Candidatus Sulfotelmatobacter sp.]|nr:hypothetical protein [Candidatus Sulfotelmatobacter sp.]
MKSSEIFEICHSRYRWLRSETNEGRIRPLVLEKPANGYSWRPVRARACEYVADFERIGRHALRRPEWKGRLKLFETYFLEGVEYRRAISLVGVAEGTFDYWFREVKRALGAEFLRTGMFPPSRYFQARSNNPGTSGQQATSDSAESGNVTSAPEEFAGRMVSAAKSRIEAETGCAEVGAVAL